MIPTQSFVCPHSSDFTSFSSRYTFSSMIHLLSTDHHVQNIIEAFSSLIHPKFDLLVLRLFISSHYPFSLYTLPLKQIVLHQSTASKFAPHTSLNAVFSHQTCLYFIRFLVSSAKVIFSICNVISPAVTISRTNLTYQSIGNSAIHYPVSP